MIPCLRKKKTMLLKNKRVGEIQLHLECALHTDSSEMLMNQIEELCKDTKDLLAEREESLKKIQELEKTVANIPSKMAQAKLDYEEYLASCSVNCNGHSKCSLFR